MNVGRRIGQHMCGPVPCPFYMGPTAVNVSPEKPDTSLLVRQTELKGPGSAVQSEGGADPDHIEVPGEQTGRRR